MDSKELLSTYINTYKDIYFYDDTHWSPIAAKIVAEKIKDTIKRNE
ncbi:MAG: hypothetical protein LBQ84_00850 [Flavobacteriaceae bacterium]|nr:hypothetical protein [Flavobacteriaceae bacterium]